MLFVSFVAGTIQIWAGRFTTTFLFTHQGIYRIGQAFHRQSSSLVHCSDYRYLTFVWGIITDHLKTVRFSADVKGVREETIKNTIRTLRKAGVIGHDKDTEAESMIGIFRGGESL